MVVITLRSATLNEWMDDSTHMLIFIGAVAGSCVVLLCIFLIWWYMFRKKKPSDLMPKREPWLTRQPRRNTFPGYVLGRSLIRVDVDTVVTRDAHSARRISRISARRSSKQGTTPSIYSTYTDTPGSSPSTTPIKESPLSGVETFAPPGLGLEGDYPTLQGYQVMAIPNPTVRVPSPVAHPPHQSTVHFHPAK
ncbi:hypothetical protein DL96DRAFT_601029 [Flagelloscypha sp. PMI_526]|nr:hypothetical protein DL96DRAFT_601029 [Flagelloscypha sp. PMI_526]